MFAHKHTLYISCVCVFVWGVKDKFMSYFLQTSARYHLNTSVNWHISLLRFWQPGICLFIHNDRTVPPSFLKERDVLINPPGGIHHTGSGAHWQLDIWYLIKGQDWFELCFFLALTFTQTKTHVSLTSGFLSGHNPPPKKKVGIKNHGSSCFHWFAQHSTTEQSRRV